MDYFTEKNEMVVLTFNRTQEGLVLILPPVRADADLENNKGDQEKREGRGGFGKGRHQMYNPA